MAPQLSEQITKSPPSAPPAKPRGVSEPSGTRAPAIDRTMLYWWLVGLLVAIYALVLLNGFFLFESKSVAPPSDRKIEVPHAGNKELMDKFRRWVIQEDGRNKPFGTFAIEVVRTVTGREKFEKNDPVAVVLSWILTYEMKPNTAGQADEEKIAEVSRKLGCDWENYPFILCDYHGLRVRIFTELKGADAELTEEESHGKYMSPADLRRSYEFRAIVAHAEQKRSEDKGAILTALELKGQEVMRRLRLYDRTRAGGEFGVAAVDGVGKVWFPLRHLELFLAPPARLTDEDCFRLNVLPELAYVPDLADAEEYRNTNPMKHARIRRTAETLRGLKSVENVDRLSGPVMWDVWLWNQRVQNEEVYDGTSFQPYPEKAFQDVVAAYRALKEAYRSQDEEQFAEAGTAFLTTLDEVGNRLNTYPDTNTTDLELQFNRVVPFQKAWIFSLIASIFLAGAFFTGTRSQAVSRALYIAGLAGFALSLGFAIYGFYARVAVSGRPPVSNMYESIIWVAFMTAIFGLALELVYRKSAIALAGALVSTFGFVLADQLPTTFSPNIEPLNAVLRSNYWLIIHVLTIVSSYAALALAWGLGNINLALIVTSPERKDMIRTLSHYSYKAIQVGVILLFLGTMLGGFWAAESWGRFWGWDPKEVWALIAFLFYIIPLHARYVGWIKDFGLAVCSVVCFSAVVMAWYGVNFVLGAGLHSYGFGAGKNEWVYMFGLLNIALVVHAGMRYISQQGRQTVSG